MGSYHRLLRRLLTASLEGAVVGVVLTTAVVGGAFALGRQDILQHPALPIMIVAVGALGLMLTGRLSRKTFEDR
ncbi:MAG: hypothetical protein AAF608_06095 [Pseudomonadota bacterium]